MNTFMRLLAAEGVDDIVSKATNTITTIFWYVLGAVLTVIVFLGVFYGIKLGIRFAKAEDSEARDKAKQQLINLIIGIAVAAVIVAVMMVLNGMDLIAKLFGHGAEEAAVEPAEETAALIKVLF